MMIEAKGDGYSNLYIITHCGVLMVDSFDLGFVDAMELKCDDKNYV